MFALTKNRALPSIAGAALSIFMHMGQPAFAAQPDPDVATLSRTISTEGLNLARPSDQARLRQRSEVAAHHVCRELMAGESLLNPAYGDCLRRAEASAHADVEARIAAAERQPVVASAK